MKLSASPLATLCFVFISAAPAATAATFQDLGLDPFLSFSAAGEGMGNAVGALPADPTNIWINPGALAFQRGYTVYLSPNDEVRDGQDNLRDRVFSVACGLGERDAVGAALILRDQNHLAVPNQASGSMDILEKSLLLSYARRFGERVGLGATVIGYKHSATSEVFDGDNTFAFTTGLLARFPFLYGGEFPMELRSGLSLANAGPTFDVGVTESALPLHARFSASLAYEKDRRNGFTLSADIYSRLRDREVQVESDVFEVRDWIDRIGFGVGGEVHASGVVTVRGGYVWDDDVRKNGRSGGTFGFDVGHRIYSWVGGALEYARAPAEFATADHLGVRFYYIPEFRNGE